MECGNNSIELTSTHATKKDKEFKSGKVLEKMVKGIPYKAQRLFEGRK